MKTILVTGCGGYVGNVLCRHLLQLGYHVRGMDNFHKGHCDALFDVVWRDEFEFMYGDVTVEDHCRKAVEGVEGIIHLAGIVGFPACSRQPALSYAVNVEGTRNILIARNRVNDKIPLVFASTGSVYGKIVDICTEESTCNPQSIYGQHKLEAERLVRNEPNTISFRFATGFGIGPCMRVNLLVNDFVYKALTERCLTVFEADAKRTFIHVKDMAYSFEKGMFAVRYSKLPQNVYNAGASELNWSKRQLAEYVKSKTGCLVTYADVGKDLDQRDYEVDYSPFERDVHDCRITMEEGIEQIIKATPLIQVRNNYA
jgi:nucleoside-diphosphate-sugar epimerase